MPRRFIARGPLVVPAAAYAGPGNVVSGAVAWWGLRAYSNATIGTNAIRLRESGGNTEQDFATIAGGGLDLSAISAFKGANNLFVVKLYDQTGNGIDVLQSSAANQPPFNLSVLGSKPAIQPSTSVGTFLASSATIIRAQPFTISAVVNRTDNSNTDGVILGNGSVSVFLQFQGANLIRMYAGTILLVSETDNTTHAFNVACNGASSDINIDGSPNTGDVGTGGISADTIVLLEVGGSHQLGGNLFETGIWPAAFSGGNSSAMSSNQHAYWGF